VEIAVSVISEKVKSGAYKDGVCSTYLTEKRPGDVIHVTIHPSTFKMPERPDIPMILVGAWLVWRARSRPPVAA
jgi:sulfite reductase alpha subunit-like flavoprotein